MQSYVYKVIRECNYLLLDGIVCPEGIVCLGQLHKLGVPVDEKLMQGILKHLGVKSILLMLKYTIHE